VLSGVAQEVNEPEITKPTQVIEEYGATLAREVHEICELCANGSAIVVERCSVKEVPFGRSPRRVADHARSAAHQSNRTTTVQLQPSKRKDTHEVANMEGIGARIKPDVGADRRVSDKALVQARGDVVDETSLSEVAEELRS
jgi:hypothetical protein